MNCELLVTLMECDVRFSRLQLIHHNKIRFFCRIPKVKKKMMYSMYCKLTAIPLGLLIIVVEVSRKSTRQPTTDFVPLPAASVARSFCFLLLFHTKTGVHTDHGDSLGPNLIHSFCFKFVLPTACSLVDELNESII